MEAIYREYILDHFQHPTHRGELEHFTIREHDSNPLCGDDLTLYVSVDSDSLITNCRFQGHGCAISQAAADILCEHLIGKHTETVLDMKKEDMLDLLGIELGPVRIKCGLLAYKIVKLGVIKHTGTVKEQAP